MDRDFISRRISEYRTTRNPLSLLKAALMIVRQKRAREVLYGVYCRLASRPSPVAGGAGISPSLLARSRSWLMGGDLRSRADIVGLFGSAFAVDALPADFAGTRMESVIRDGDALIVGEYGHGTKRLAYVTPAACTISDFYSEDSRVDHIHAVGRSSAGEIFVTTGDSLKALDSWMVRAGRLEFRRRLRRRLAGYTAIIEAGGRLYFGTDFSSRPNYIETLEGEKFFFPAKAYDKYVLSFRLEQERYILSINRRIAALGGGSTLSVFDPVEARFLFCEDLLVQPDDLPPAAADTAAARGREPRSARAACSSRRRPRTGGISTAPRSRRPR